MARLQLAPVAQGLTDFEAKVVTARLGADGILWELRGIVDGMYPLGRIDVLVPVDELDAARQCLVSDDIGVMLVPADHDAGEASLVGAGGHAAATGAGSPRRWWVTVAVVAAAVAFSLARFAGVIAWLGHGGGDECSPRAAAEGFTARCRH